MTKYPLPLDWHTTDALATCLHGNRLDLLTRGPLVPELVFAWNLTARVETRLRKAADAWRWNFNAVRKFNMSGTELLATLLILRAARPSHSAYSEFACWCVVQEVSKRLETFVQLPPLK